MARFVPPRTLRTLQLKSFSRKEARPDRAVQYKLKWTSNSLTKKGLRGSRVSGGHVVMFAIQTKLPGIGQSPASPHFIANFDYLRFDPSGGKLKNRGCTSWRRQGTDIASPLQCVPIRMNYASIRGLPSTGPGSRAALLKTEGATGWPTLRITLTRENSATLRT